MDSRQQLEFRIKCAMNALGVGQAQRAGYLTFSRSVEKARKTVHGKDLVAFAGVLVERYAKMGLERRVMYRLLSDVHTIRPVEGWPKR